MSANKLHKATISLSSVLKTGSRYAATTFIWWLPNKRPNTSRFSVDGVPLEDDAVTLRIPKQRRR